MNTVVVQNDEIRLNSGLNEYFFGKTNYFTMISENGLVYDSNKDDFSPWKFQGVATYKDNIKTDKFDESLESEASVFYCGRNPLCEKAMSLLDYFNNGGDNLYKAVVLVCKAMTTAVKSDKKLPAVGAGGIIVDTENSKVLFLPEDIFKYSTNLLSQEQYFNENSGWTNRTITGNPAICYERALIVYKLLTKRFPYPAVDETERNADILDKNFLPLELCIEEINMDFAREINRALKLNSTSVSIPGKKKKGVDSEDLTIHPDFNFEHLEKAWELSKKKNISEKELAEKAGNYIKTQKSKIEAKRKLRRNTTSILAAAGVAVLIIIMAVSSAHKQNRQFTSKGLTSTEVIQVFFQGINSKDMKQMNPLVRGEAPEQYLNNITNLFLLEKQIIGFTKETVYGNPGFWLLNVTNNERFSKLRVYGVTNLKIDGKPVESEVKMFRKSDNPEVITFDNNKTLSPGDTVNHNVDYYFLQTNPEDYSVTVEKRSEIYTLTYRNEKWIITDIDSVIEQIPVDTEEFKKDYFMALAVNNNDIVKVLDSLRPEYEWLPSDYAVEQEYLKILEEEKY